MTIRGKLGTHSTCLYQVARKRKPPILGEKVLIRSTSDYRCFEWTKAQVDEIRDVEGPFYFLTLL